MALMLVIENASRYPFPSVVIVGIGRCCDLLTIFEPMRLMKSGTSDGYETFYRNYTNTIQTRSTKRNPLNVNVALENPKKPPQLREQVRFRI